jgi:hypothetical protein
LRHRAALGWRGAAGAALGGLLMGIGARLSSGCNVGAFIGGAASGSLHGLVWLAPSSRAAGSESGCGRSSACHGADRGAVARPAAMASPPA